MPGAPVRLRCEYLEDPLGIEERAPRLSWWPDDPRPAELQTGYEIVAASTLDLLALDEGDLWHSGRVEGQQSFNIVYRGKRLVSARRVWWKVRTFDSDGLPGPWSESAFFEAGLFDAADWRGQWIAAPLTGSRATAVPVPCLRRRFDLAAPPRQARLYIAACGLQQVEINGASVNGEELTPGWAGFDTHVPYRTYDVTTLLQAGNNVIGVLLGDGWFCGRSGLGEREHYGQRPQLCAQLHMVLESGATLIISSDRQWQWRPSWILRSDPIDGESCDWRQYDPNWSSSVSREGWHAVEVCERNVEYRGLLAEPVHKLRELVAVLRNADDRRYLFELPQVAFAAAVIECSLPAGALLRVRYGLELDEQGELIAGPGEDVHIARGSETLEKLSARFARHGFRYLEISGDLFALNGIEVSVDVYGQAAANAAHFICDHADLNTLYESLNAHQQACLQGVPFAGLSPRLRHGQLKAAGAGIRAGLLTTAAAAAYRSWLTQISAAALQDGLFPAVVPTPPDLDALTLATDSGDALLEGVWLLFRLFGDRALLEICIPAISRYLAAQAQLCPDHIRGEAPEDLLATVDYYHCVRTAARMAGVLGNLVDLEDHELLAVAIRQAFRRRFVTADGRLAGDNLQSYNAALSQGLLESTERPRALTELFRHLEVLAQQGQLSAALAPEMLRTLTLLGRVDLALALVVDVAAKQQPLSDQVYSELRAAGVIEWMLGSLAGMDLGRDLSESHNAFRRMRIAPRPVLGSLMNASDRFSEGPPLRAVEATLDTISGRYQISWAVTDEAFELTVTVPCNCAADVILPDDSVHEVVAGTHSFSMPFNQAGDGIPILREVSAGN